MMLVLFDLWCEEEYCLRIEVGAAGYDNDIDMVHARDANCKFDSEKLHVAPIVCLASQKNGGPIISTNQSKQQQQQTATT